jgi:hypothetical protein
MLQCSSAFTVKGESEPVTVSGLGNNSNPHLGQLEDTLVSAHLGGGGGFGRMGRFPHLPQFTKIGRFFGKVWHGFN